MITFSMFAFVSPGKRANSAAIHPRLRTILRIAFLRCSSFHSGKARRRLNSAVFFSFGLRKKRRPAMDAAKPLASGLRNAPIVLSTSQTVAYSSHSLMVFRDGRTLAVARQYARGARFEDRGSMLDFPLCDRFSLSQFRNRAAQFSSPHRLGPSDCRNTLRLLFQPSECYRFCRTGRAAICLDCARHGRNGRLDHAAALWKTVVRKTSALLLGRRD